MNIRELETFLTLYETCSFTKTAQKLGMAQPAVSKHIFKLEEDLGHKLFLRTKKSVKPTEEAVQLMLKFRPLISEMNQSWNDLKNQNKNLQGLIRIGSIVEPGEQYLFELITAFKQKNPDIRFQLELKQSSQIITDVKNGLLDFGLVFDLPNPQGLRVYPVLEDSSVLVGNKKMFFDDTKINDFEYITYHRDDSLLRFFMEKAFGKRKVKNLNINFSVNSHRLLKKYLQNEEAIAILPLSSIKEELKEKKLVLLSEKKIDYQLSLITADQRFVEEHKEAFKNFFMAELKKLKIN